MNVLTEEQKTILCVEFVRRGMEITHAVKQVNSQSMEWICWLAYAATGKPLRSIVGPREIF